MEKITVALLKDLQSQVSKEEITYSRMVEILNEHVFPKKPFEIYNQSTTSFSFMDRIRILFGKKFHINLTLFVSHEVQIIEKDKITSWVENIFPSKSKGYAETPIKALNKQP